MSLAWLTASLALWKRRHRYRQIRLDMARKAKQQDANRIAKWHKLLVDSGKMVHRREQQIAAKKPLRPVTWMPGVRHLPRSDAGGWAVNCPAKGVLHTTEGSGDATSTLDANGDHPHFQVERNGRITQYIAVNRSAKALRHIGSPETNRARAIQIEVCGFAAHPDWPARQKAAVRQVMRFIEANAGVQRVSHVQFVSGGGKRLSGTAWLSLAGWCGHQHVPENDHVDPGPIDIAGLLK